MVSVNNGPYTVTDPTIDPGDTLSLQWSSTDTTNCAATQGSGFAASGPSGTDPVNSPAPNTSDTFQVTCTGPGGNATAAVAVSTRQKPNFNQPNMTISNPGTFDPVTATYGYVDIIFSTANNGGSATKSAAPYQVDFTGKPAITGSIPSGLTVGAAGYNTTVRVPGPIPFGTATVKVSIDTPIATNGSVPEVTEGDADNTRTATLTIPPPDPGLTLTADKVRLRNTETTTIRWSIATTYAGLSCQTRGPGINTTSQAGNQSTPPVTAKNEYTFKCVEGTTGTTWQKTATVETEGVIEEI